MRLVRTAPTALLLFIAGSAFASPTASTGVSPLALSSIDYAPMMATVADATPSVATIVPAGSPVDPNATTLAEYRRHDDPYRDDAIRYRPYYRDRGYRRRSYGESPAQIHFGFFDPDGHGPTSFLLGLRGGPMVGPNLQLGASADWIYRTDDQTVVAGEPFQQGGTTITPTRVLSSASTNLFPFMLFAQVSGDQNQSLIPYGGIGGGWEVLFLSADDFTTGDHFNATFTGWGWQAWLGAGVPLSGQARLNGEVYVNESEPERDVDDPTSGLTFREKVKANGVGGRLGFQFGF